MSESRYLDALIRALARQAVDDYLSGEAAPGNDSEGSRSNPPTLPDMDKAA